MSTSSTTQDKPLSDGDCYEFPVVWREEADGLRAEVRYEQYDAEIFDPRSDDCESNLGTMVCWHPDYILGDEQIKNADGRGAVKNAHAHSGRFRSIGTLARWARIAEQAPVVIPLYLFDHSGISMSAGSNAVGRGDTASGGWDEFGNARGWDTTLVGVIYTTPARVRELCGEPREGQTFYCPPDWEGTPEAWLESQLKAEVGLYDAYLRGEVFWYSVEEIETEDTIDSCGGYLPDVTAKHDRELDYIKQEARGALELALEQRREAAETEKAEAERAARQDIATRED